LHESLVEMPRPDWTTSAAIQIPTEGPTFAAAGAGTIDAEAFAGATHAKEHDSQARNPLDPNSVIAAAFRAAGLPVPEVPTAPSGTPHVASGPIIAAALKAARMLRS
jgi:hypothetical protein